MMFRLSPLTQLLIAYEDWDFMCSQTEEQEPNNQVALKFIIVIPLIRSISNVILDFTDRTNELRRVLLCAPCVLASAHSCCNDDVSESPGSQNELMPSHALLLINCCQLRAVRSSPRYTSRRSWAEAELTKLPASHKWKHNNQEGSFLAVLPPTCSETFQHSYWMIHVMIHVGRQQWLWLWGGPGSVLAIFRTLCHKCNEVRTAFSERRL